MHSINHQLSFFTCILILFLSTTNCYSQNTNLINVDQNLKILEIDHVDNIPVKPYLIKDYDNEDNIWIGTYSNYTTYLNRIGVGLDTIESYQSNYSENCGMKYFKYDSLFYSFKYFTRHDFGFMLYDSFYVGVYDSKLNKLFEKKLIDNSNSIYNFPETYICEEHGIMLTEDRNILFYQIDILSNPDTAFLDINLFDLSGNLIKKNLLPIKIKPRYSRFSLIETQDAFKMLIIEYNYKVGNKVEYNNITLNIDKSNLIIQSIDSIINSDKQVGYNSARKINDSILVSYGFMKSEVNEDKMGINIINYLSGSVNQFQFDKWRQDTTLIFPHNPFYFLNYFDFKREDSIYFCYDTRYVENLGGGIIGVNSGYLTILNFNINGDINFSYKVEYDTINFAGIMGMKVIGDNNLLVTGILNDKCWILKFSPNGFVGLTNIETNEKESIRVYPNPAKDFINVDIEADRFSSSEIELFDIQGRLVKKSKLNAQIGNRIDVSMLNPGAYNYRVVINGKGISGKVIIGE